MANIIRMSGSPKPDIYVPEGYEIKTGTKGFPIDDTVIPIYAYGSISGTQWTEFSSGAYLKDNLGKIWLSVQVPGHGSKTNSGYVDVFKLYNGDYEQLKQITKVSATGSQSPNGSASLKVWLEKVGEVVNRLLLLLKTHLQKLEVC